MKVYAVNAKDGESALHFATKGEAVKEARVAAVEYAPEGETIEVEELTLVPMNKAAIVRLLNAEGGYVDSTRVVYRIKSKRKVEA